MEQREHVLLHNWVVVVVRNNDRDKLREILGLDPTTIVEYKLHKQSLVDGSTFRNAQAYVFAAKPEETPAEEKKEAE